MAVFSFCLFLLIFTVIGLSSLVKSRADTADYLVADRSVRPWLVALSAVATNNSGYMFTGMIGFTYLVGWPSVWLMFGWLAGDFAASLLIHKKIRVVSEKRGIQSFSGLMSRWHGEDFRWVRLLAGLISLVFLGSYAAAQFNAGSKALHILFGWDMSAGAVIGSLIVLVYCLAGGIRASIWTDAAQSFVMFAAMILLVVTSAAELGGWSEVLRRLQNVGGSYLEWFPEDLPVSGLYGALLFAGGWLFAGFGVVGQPHIMVRFMTMDHAKNIGRVRAYYYLWFFLFYALTIAVGLMTRLLIPQENLFDAELALPKIAAQLLPPYLVGIVLAGIFAATMSTADSLILSCSAVLTRDFLPRHRSHHLVTKAGTFIMTAAALVMALTANKNVFQLVLYSWAVLGAAFGPLLTVYCLGQKTSQPLTAAMMLTGTAAVLLWSYFGLGSYIYEIVPGILLSFAVFLVGKMSGQVTREDEANAVLEHPLTHK